MDDFKTSFLNINYNTSCFNFEAEDFCNNHDLNQSNNSYPDRDCPITLEEVKNAIKSLKRAEAIGNDSIMKSIFY